MERFKLLIADSTEEFRLAMADTLRGNYYIRTCADGRHALELLRSYRPDVVILDLMLPGMDGISILQIAGEEGIHPVVLATTRFVNDYVLEAAGRVGVGYVMVKPCDIKATVSRLNDLVGRIREPVYSRQDPRSQVSNMLLSLGVPAKLKGYHYLREAILLVMRQPDQSITKELYPAVGAACNAAAEHVERSSRNAIMTAWNRRDVLIWRLYFPAAGSEGDRRPTNTEFITRLADALRINGEENEKIEKIPEK